MIKIREAKPGDEQSIHDLVYALAVYESAKRSCYTPAQLAIDLFESKICYACSSRE